MDKIETKFNVLKKKTITPFGKEMYLLGRRRADNKKVYLENFSWDCGWYWSGGYLEVLNRPHTDISMHYHFERFGKDNNLKDGFDNEFKDTPFTEDEIWRLCDLFKQFYTLRECAEVFKWGGSYTSKGRTKQEIKPKLNITLNRHIETVIIPEILKIVKVEWLRWKW